MSKAIKQFDEVLLMDGRRGAVVEVFGDQEVFEVDVGSSPKDWETITVNRSQIAKVL
jgi:preprotein translocase subunit YajC